MREPSPFDALASDYDSWFEQDGKLVFAIETQALRQLLPSLPKPWIEIGVGSGRFAQPLGIELGLDPSIELLRMSKGRGIDCCWGTGETQPFRDESFGTAFLIVTLCFVSSPLDVLRETHRILRGKGTVMLGMVLRESPWGQFYGNKGAQGHRFYQHATFYSFEDVTALLTEAGFVCTRTISTLFQKPGQVANSEPPQEGYHPSAGFTLIMARKYANPRESSTI